MTRFSLLQLSFRILSQEKKVPAEEFKFFLHGGVVVDRYVCVPQDSRTSAFRKRRVRYLVTFI